ncbi:MAG: MerR family DNA-binding protein [Pseudomonadota bacterium]
MSEPQLLTRGKLASRGGVNIATIRYYEKRGLLPDAPRSRSGYRLYTDDALRRLHFIRQSQVLGFSLNEVGELLSLRMQAGTTCADIRQRARRKIETVDGKIKDLQRIKRALTKLADACQGAGPTSECPILESLEGARNTQ